MTAVGIRYYGEMGNSKIIFRLQVNSGLTQNFGSTATCGECLDLALAAPANVTENAVEYVDLVLVQPTGQANNEADDDLVVVEGTTLAEPDKKRTYFRK